MTKRIDVDTTKTYSSTSTWPAKPVLGEEYQDADGTVYRFIQAGGAITALNFLTHDLAEGTHHMHHTSAVEQPIRAIAHIAIADNYQGWVVVHGAVSGCNVGTPSQGDRLGSSGTAGRADTLSVSASPTQNEVEGILHAGKNVWALANASGNAAACFIE